MKSIVFETQLYGLRRLDAALATHSALHQLAECGGSTLQRSTPKPRLLLLFVFTRYPEPEPRYPFLPPFPVTQGDRSPHSRGNNFHSKQ